MGPFRTTRRQLLSTAGTASIAGLAGCSGVTDQSFAADPVVLPEAAQEELVLAETVREGHTIERSGPGGIEVSITNQASLYRRSPARGTPTLMEQFLSTANGTPGSGSALIATASELGIQEANPAFIDEDVSVNGDRITLVIPEAVRSDGEVRVEELMSLDHGDAFPVEELTSRGENNYLVDAASVLPNAGLIPVDPQKATFEPHERWLPENEQWVNAGDSLRCLVCLGERSPQSVFGVEQMPGRSVEPGETIGTEDTILFKPAPKEMPSPDGNRLNPSDAATVFDRGIPAPLGPALPYGLAALATPDASVLGQSVNPVVNMDTKGLLQHEAIRRMLNRTALPASEDATVEWLAGPEEVATGGRSPFTLLGEDTEPQGFAGVVSGNDGPWHVTLEIARVTPDDHVIAASVIWQPVGTPEEGMEAEAGGGIYINKPVIFSGYREITAEAMNRFAPHERK